jgi:hypothetical protein
VENSLLLKAYVSIDRRFRDLCFLVRLSAAAGVLQPRDAFVGSCRWQIKHWAKRRKVNDPYRGTLSSYGYVLMIINFLQLRRSGCELRALARTPALSLASSRAQERAVTPLPRSRPAVLPCLQAMPHEPVRAPGAPRGRRAVHGWWPCVALQKPIYGFECGYYKDLARLADFGRANTETVEELLVSVRPAASPPAPDLPVPLWALRRRALRRRRRRC